MPREKNGGHGPTTDVVGGPEEREGEVVFVTDGMLKMEGEMREERLIGEAKGVLDDRKELEGRERRLMNDGKKILDDGGSLETAMSVWEALPDGVDKRTWLRYVVGEATKRGQVERALELTELETDARAKERDLAHIAATCGEKGDWKNALGILVLVKDAFFHDHALWRMVPEMAKIDKIEARKMADRILNQETREKAMQSIETGERVP